MILSANVCRAFCNSLAALPPFGGGGVLAVLKTDLMDRLTAMIKVKETAQLKKTDGAKKNRVTGIAKLDDANFAVYLICVASF